MKYVASVIQFSVHSESIINQPKSRIGLTLTNAFEINLGLTDSDTF